jgi:hypothetical protein
VNKKTIILGLAGGCVLALSAKSAVTFFVNLADGISEGLAKTSLQEVTFNEETDEMTVTSTDGTSLTYAMADIADMDFRSADNVVVIKYSDNSVEVDNPYAFAGVTVTAEGAHVTVNSTSSEEIEYQLSGSTTDGGLKIYQTNKSVVKLKGVSITNPSGAAINVQGKKLSLSAAADTENYLADGETYNTPDGEKEKGTVYSKGKIELKGNGKCTIVSNYKHAICSDGDISQTNGTFIVSGAVTDAIHCDEGFAIEKGTLEMSPSDDGIDAGAGDVTITGGTIKATITGDTSKAIKTDTNVTISGGTLEFTMSGNAVVTDGDVSYCTAIKGVDVTVSGGSLTLNHTGKAGRGISTDGNLTISGGEFDFTLTGAGDTYTNTSNESDSYVAKGMKSDADVVITGGNIKIKTTGTAAKCIESGANMTIGEDGTEGPTLDLYASGGSITLSSGGSGWGGGWNAPGGGGWGGGGGFGGGGNDNSDHSVSKGLKAKGDLVINSGNITANTPGSGAEGIESKGGLTINGGYITATSEDDAINGGTYVKITGGYVYAYATNNDGIDSNGYFDISGGVILASGAASPEEGFDYDTGYFTLTGGILIGLGGSESQPTTSKSTQRSVIYNAGSVSSGAAYRISKNGEDVITFKVPRQYSSCKMLLSSPEFDSSTTFTITKGGTISGGTEFNGYFEGADYTGGSTAKTFKCSSMVTSI